MKFSSDSTFPQFLTLQMLKQGFGKFNASLDYISMSKVSQTTHIDTLSQEKNTDLTYYERVRSNLSCLKEYCELNLTA